MLTLEQREKLSEEINISAKELDEMWKFCGDNGHDLIKALNKCGKTWRDLNTAAIKTLPGEYERMKKGER